MDIKIVRGWICQHSEGYIEEQMKDIIVEALEKQMPRTLESGTEGGVDWYCECGHYISRSKHKSYSYCNYCDNCGQKIDWETE